MWHLGNVLVVGLAMLGQHLGLMILECFSNLNDSVILRFYNNISCTISDTDVCGVSTRVLLVLLFIDLWPLTSMLWRNCVVGDPAWCQGCCFALWSLATFLWWGSLGGHGLFKLTLMNSSQPTLSLVAVIPLTKIEVKVLWVGTEISLCCSLYNNINLGRSCYGSV